MGLILAKLVLTPLVILAASLASRRWGDAVGGWLVGLPLISGPVSAFLTIERGPEFAAAASAGSIAGVAAEACFCMGYAALAKRGWVRAFLGGGLAYLASAALWTFLQPPLLGLMAIAAALLAVARALLPHAGPAPVSLPAPRWDIPARMAIVTVVVIGVTMLATTLGPAYERDDRELSLDRRRRRRLRPSGSRPGRRRHRAARHGERAVRLHRVFRRDRFSRRRNRTRARFRHRDGGGARRAERSRCDGYATTRAAPRRRGRTPVHSVCAGF